tara:strand:+ start:1672 stop:2358 length:687 start_codon:yes stop_codon:yes gene_type:complete
MNTVYFKNWGLIDFKAAWERQESLLDSIIKDKRQNKPTKNYLIFCQHSHVYTLGKSGNKKNLLLNDFELKSSGVDYYKINRGGDITYHGPGQLVIYPIFDLDNFFTDIHKYLRFLEDIVINVLKKFLITGIRISGSTGVWVPHKEKNLTHRKICAMGVRASRWVTMHGIAFNVDPDLSYFNNIIPCGIQNKGVTSLKNELDKNVSFEKVEEIFKSEFSEVFKTLIIDY